MGDVVLFVIVLLCAAVAIWMFALAIEQAVIYGKKEKNAAEKKPPKIPLQIERNSNVYQCPQCTKFDTPNEEKPNPSIEKTMVSHPSRPCPKCGLLQRLDEERCPNCGTLLPVISTVNPEKKIVSAAVSKESSGDGAFASDGKPVIFPYFFYKYTKSSTKGWMKWLPILGFISAIGYLFLAAYSFGNGSAAGEAMAIYHVVDAACVGTLSFLMWKFRASWCYASFATYCATVGVLNLLVSGTGYNLFWIAFAVYTSVKARAIENAYILYLQSGDTPKEPI